jgi:PKD repeat protein
MATCPAISVTETPDGTITIKLKVGTPLAFAAPAAPGVGSAFTWDGSKAGTALTGIQGNTYLFVGAAAGILETVQATGATGSYTRVGNASCQTGLPIAALTATPNPVNVNQNVTFNASGSHEPTGACGTINSYTLDFGDGSPTVTQSTPTGGGFTHAYSAPGNYPARLTVKDTAGLSSTNGALVVITVNTSIPQLTGVVSQMVHGTAGIFEVQLFPLINGKRGVECRNSGTLGAGNYKLVFGFANSLTSVTGASVTSGTGSVSSSMINSVNPQQYIVNLTGVADQQYITVTLNGVHDSTGATGDIVGPQMGVLLGDVNASGRVDAADVSSVRQQTLQTVTTSNFRDDINASGRIDAADVSVARQNTLHSLPSTP